MKISKANLKKGMFLYVEFQDGDALISKSCPHTEAPPKLVKAFSSLNSHICELTEQYDKTGEYDFDMVVCRGYSINDKDMAILTGLRTLSDGGSLTLNSKNVSLNETSEYAKVAVLIDKLDRCRTEILSFMGNNPSQEEIQGKLDFAKKNGDTILSSNKEPGTDVTALYIPDENLTPQDMEDLKHGSTQEIVQAANAKANKAKGKRK